MKKLNLPKKYPLLISVIVSCLLIVASVFILGFFGLKLGVALGGGTRFEVQLESADKVKQCQSTVKDVLKKHHLLVDSSFVEDKYELGDGEKTDYTRKMLVVQINKTGISDEEKAQIKSELIEALKVSPSYVSDISDIPNSVSAKHVLFIPLGIGIVAICFFIFGWIRYGILAGISFIIAFLHNIILYLSLLILTRVQLTLLSLSIAIILTLVMSVVLVFIYEKYREQSKLQNADKISVSERMINSEKETTKPFLIILGAAILVCVGLLFIPANVVRFSALSSILAILVTLYTTLIVGPASCTAMLEIRDMNRRAILSRNENVNKAIKKKVKKNQAVKTNKK